MLVEGPAGWGEFCPFPEYGDAECVPWLAAAVEAAQVGWPAPVRDRVPVNAIVPAVSPSDAYDAGQGGGLRHGEGEGGRRAGLARRRRRAGGGGPGRARARRCGAGGRQRGVVGRRGGGGDPGAGRARQAGWSTSSSRVRRWRSSRPCDGGWTCGSRRTSRSAGPRTPCGWRWPRPPTSRCSSARRSAGCGGRSRWPRRAGCRASCPRRCRPASAWRRRSRWRERCRSCRSRAGWAPARCSPSTWWTQPLVPHDGWLPVPRRAPVPVPDPAWAAPPDRAAWWAERYARVDVLR